MVEANHGERRRGIGRLHGFRASFTRSLKGSQIVPSSGQLTNFKQLIDGVMKQRASDEIARNCRPEANVTISVKVRFFNARWRRLPHIRVRKIKIIDFTTKIKSGQHNFVTPTSRVAS